MCLNSEHSWADAPITGHLWESIIADDTLKFGYDESGHTKGIVRFDLPMPNKLNWNITPDVHLILKLNYFIFKLLKFCLFSVMKLLMQVSKLQQT